MKVEEFGLMALVVLLSDLEIGLSFVRVSGKKMPRKMRNTSLKLKK